MALEIRHNQEQTHENVAFRRISILLEAFFRENNWEGLLMGNPSVEGFENFKPDAILFTPKAVVIIDLKEYKGELLLPEDDEYDKKKWLIDGDVTVRGGSSINPFCQIGKHKKTFGEILLKWKDKNPKAYQVLRPQGIKTDKTRGLVIFSGPISFKNDKRVPGLYKWFSITDESTLLNTIKDYNEGIEFDSLVGNFIKSIFKADPYKIQNNVVTSVTSGFDHRPDLWGDQKVVLGHVKEFLKQSRNRILIIDGPEKCGKSFLVPSITSLCYDLKINQVNHLVAASRIANKINSIQKEVHYQSIYGTIYGGEPQKEVQNQEEESDDDESIDVIPIMSDEDWQNDTVAIFDEAQLLSDSPHQTELMRFGSGKLLTDIFAFIKFSQNLRKIIFIGDPNQLTFGDQELSAIKPAFLESLAGVGVRTIHIKSTKPFSKHSRIEQNLRLAHSIEINNFNRLQFFESNEVYLTEIDKIYSIIDGWLQRNQKFIVLSFSNEEADDVNRKIRSELLKKTSAITDGDLLVLHNTIRVLNTDPLAKTRYLANSTLIRVLRDLQTIEEKVYRKNKQPCTLIFREIEVSLIDEQIPFRIIVLENFRVSQKAKLLPEEAIAFRIFINKKVSEELKKKPFEDSIDFLRLKESDDWTTVTLEIENFKGNPQAKDKLLESEKKLKKLVAISKQKYRYQFKNEFIKYNAYAQSAHVRFGWSMTVHKAIGEHWPAVVINTQMGANPRNNLTYFQWLYSAISRSVDKVFLLNNKNHHPLSIAIFDNATAENISSVIPKPKGKSMGFEVLDATDDFKQSYFNDSVPQSVINYAFSFYQFLKIQDFAVHDFDYKNPWTVRIKGKDIARNTFTLIFNYDKKGIPTPIRLEGKPTSLIQAFLESLKAKDEDNHDLIFPSVFRKDIYELWKAKLRENGWIITAINSFEWLDKYWITKEDSWCVFDVYSNAEEFISSVKVYKISSPDVWSEIVLILKEIYNE